MLLDWSGTRRWCVTWEGRLRTGSVNNRCRISNVHIWALIQYKDSFYHYRKSYCGDKTVVRSSYLPNGISYTGKMASLYWISPLLYSLSQAQRKISTNGHHPAQFKSAYRNMCDIYSNANTTFPLAFCVQRQMRKYKRIAGYFDLFQELWWFVN